MNEIPNPPMDTPIQAGDRLIVIAADDDTIRLSSQKELGILEKESVRYPAKLLTQSLR